MNFEDDIDTQIAKKLKANEQENEGQMNKKMKEEKCNYQPY